jgi:hypothetical protein
MLLTLATRLMMLVGFLMLHCTHRTCVKPGRDGPAAVMLRIVVTERIDRQRRHRVRPDQSGGP